MNAAADEVAVLRMISERGGKLASLRDVAAVLKKFSTDAAAYMGRLQREGKVAYYLTIGYAITPFGREFLTQDSQQVAEGGTFAHRSVGSRMPAAINVPDAQVAGARKIEKMKEFAAQRARTRARLRDLAQETIGERRPLRTLRA